MKKIRLGAIFTLVGLVLFYCKSHAPLITSQPHNIIVNILDVQNKVVKSKNLAKDEITFFMKVFNSSRRIYEKEAVKEALKEGSYDILIETERTSYSYLLMNSRNFYRNQNNEFYENAELYQLIRSYFQ
jgi:hypothetical protein